MMETRKAFKKLPNIEQAITALSNLKGVGTTMASALIAAAAPETAPFMADECLMAIPEIEGIDYTTKEYLNFVQHIQATVDRLNGESAQANAAAKKAAEACAEAEAIPAVSVPGEENDDDTTTTTTSSRNSPVTESVADTNGAEAAAAAAPVPKPWSPHNVELALWTHYVASELQPNLLNGIPGGDNESVGASISSKFQQNGAIDEGRVERILQLEGI